jgi:hypothetical protein
VADTDWLSNISFEGSAGGIMLILRVAMNAVGATRTYLKNVFCLPPLTGLVPRLKSSTYNSMPPVYDPQRFWDEAGSPAKRGSSASPQS